MFNSEQAKTLVKIYDPELKIEDCFLYEKLWIVRVKQPSEDEEDYDPFLSVNVNTGEVKEFSVLTDSDPIKLAEAFRKRQNL